VLVQGVGSDRILHLSSLGAPLHTEASSAFFSERDRATLGTLPVKVANAVMRDAQERLATSEFMPDPDLAAGVEVDFRLGSIESIAWNLCRGSAGPTRTAMGICPDVTISGWRMVVLGGLKQNPFRLVYYIPNNVDQDRWIPQPDGLQSLPLSVQTRILQAVAKQANVPVSQLRIHWADTRLFDRCLSVNAQAVHCRSEIRPGWHIEVLVSPSTPTTSWEQTLWVYHTNLTGTDVRLVSRGTWTPPPAVPPAR
jgi:hypothetical protein